MRKIKKILLKIVIHFLSIVKPIIYIILFGEVGIRLYLRNFDKMFWTFLIIGWFLLYLIHWCAYESLFEEVKSQYISKVKNERKSN